MRRRFPTIILTVALTHIFCVVAPVSAATQTQAKSLAERLGYTPGAKLLIVHADDLGVAHSVDAASVKAFESGLVTSGSIMVPCPWFPEIAAYARSNPEADLGLHLTLTSEWSLYRWGPVLSKERAPTLFDQSGYFYATEDVAAAHIAAREAEAEIRAQIERARAYGIQPTHLDSHMGTLYQNKELFDVLLRVARDNGLPVRASKDMLAVSPSLASVIKPDDVSIARIVTIHPAVPPEPWAELYTDAITDLQPAVT